MEAGTSMANLKPHHEKNALGDRPANRGVHQGSQTARPLRGDPHSVGGRDGTHSAYGKWSRSRSPHFRVQRLAGRRRHQRRERSTAPQMSSECTLLRHPVTMLRPARHDPASAWSRSRTLDVPLRGTRHAPDRRPWTCCKRHSCIELTHLPDPAGPTCLAIS